VDSSAGRSLKNSIIYANEKSMQKYGHSANVAEALGKTPLECSNRLKELMNESVGIKFYN
jgi:hypothetical protein